jgi:AraC-like DNA-binding protein
MASHSGGPSKAARAQIGGSSRAGDHSRDVNMTTDEKDSERDSPKAPPDRATVAAAARLMLLANPRISVTKIAIALGVSRRTVERSVRLSFDLSFRALRNQVLLDRLTQLALQYPDGSIKQAAYEVGYAHPRSLSRHIRKLTGVSPKELRQK